MSNTWLPHAAQTLSRITKRRYQSYQPWYGSRIFSKTCQEERRGKVISCLKKELEIKEMVVVNFLKVLPKDVPFKIYSDLFF